MWGWNLKSLPLHRQCFLAFFLNILILMDIVLIIIINLIFFIIDVDMEIWTVYLLGASSLFPGILNSHGHLHSHLYQLSLTILILIIISIFQGPRKPNGVSARSRRPHLHSLLAPPQPPQCPPRPRPLLLSNIALNLYLYLCLYLYL